MLILIGVRLGLAVGNTRLRGERSVSAIRFAHSTGSCQEFSKNLLYVQRMLMNCGSVNFVSSLCAFVITDLKALSQRHRREDTEGTKEEVRL